MRLLENVFREYDVSFSELIEKLYPESSLQ